MRPLWLEVLMVLLIALGVGMLLCEPVAYHPHWLRDLMLVKLFGFMALGGAWICRELGIRN